MSSKKTINSGISMIIVSAILIGGFLVATCINPGWATSEVFAMSLIAGFLSGIYVEIKRANDLRADKD